MDFLWKNSLLPIPLSQLFQLLQSPLLKFKKKTQLLQLVIVCLACLRSLADDAIEPRETIPLFNGKDFSPFDNWIAEKGSEVTIDAFHD